MQSKNMIYPIITIPDKVLRTKSDLVDKIDSEVLSILENMAETMYAAPGIGLAAIQVGIKKRLVVIDCEHSEDKKKHPLFMVNPEIVWTSSELNTYKEGCLSIPEFYEEIKRPSACRVKYLDKKNKVQFLDCEGLLATCVQHEIDHLDGKLFIDYLSRLKRNSIEKKFIKQYKQKA
jgi:peptide deformylase